MKQKAPTCLREHAKMRKVYCLTTTDGKKRWVPVGWTCPICGMLEVDKKKFPEMGHGLPGAPACPDCENPMKSLYSQVEGKNQMKRLKGMFACFSVAHEVKTIPEQLSDDYRVVYKSFREAIQNHGKEIMYEYYEKAHGTERASEIRSVESQRTIHGRMMAAWSLSGIDSHIAKMVYSDGRVGDFVFPPETWRFSLQIRDDPPWDIIEEQLKEIGVKMNEYDKVVNPEPYINTGIMLKWIDEHVPKMIGAIGVLFYLLTPAYIFSNAYKLYGTMMAYSFFEEANDENISIEERRIAEEIFIELLNYGFDIRIVSSEHHFLKYMRRQIHGSEKTRHYPQ